MSELLSNGSTRRGAHRQRPRQAVDPWASTTKAIDELQRLRQADVDAGAMPLGPRRKKVALSHSRCRGCERLIQ